MILPQVTYNLDGTEGATQEEQETSQSQADTDQGQEVAEEQKVPGWISALPDELKGNEYVKGFQKPGDFVKESLDLKTKLDDLSPKLEKAIFKPGEDASDQEVSDYYKAIGVPEKPEDYDFPKSEGVEHDDKMTDWARNAFHEAKIPKEQAAILSQEWDKQIKSLAKEQEDAEQAGIDTATTELKEEWKADYDKNFAETQRGYQAFEKAAPGFAEFLALDTKNGISIGNHPMMLKVFHVIGQKIGDDLSISSIPPKLEKKVEGFQSIYKTPNPAR